MRLDERLEKEKQRKKKQAARAPEDEETMDYLTRKADKQAFNERTGIFNSPLSEGINTEKGIFDRQALFFREKEEL